MSTTPSKWKFLWEQRRVVRVTHQEQRKESDHDLVDKRDGLRNRSVTDTTSSGMRETSDINTSSAVPANIVDENLEESNISALRSRPGCSALMKAITHLSCNLLEPTAILANGPPRNIVCTCNLVVNKKVDNVILLCVDKFHVFGTYRSVCRCRRKCPGVQIYAAT